MTEPLQLDDGQLTLGDMEDVESALGYPMAEAMSRPGGQWRLACAMIYIRRRRIDPGFTFDDARALPMEALAAMVEDVESITAQFGQGDQIPHPPQPSTIA